MYQESILDNLENVLYNDKRSSISIGLENNSGKIDINSVQINNDISLYKNTMNFFKSTSMNSSSSESGLFIDITLNGNVNYTDNILNSTIEKKQNTVFVKYMNLSESTLEAEENTNSKNIGIIVKGNFLEEFFLQNVKNYDNLQKRYEQNIPSLLKKAKTDAKTTISANEIFNSPFCGKLDYIYLQSKVYEIIHNEFKDILQPQLQTRSKKIKLNEDDIQALLKAKKLISQEKYFSTLIKLSRKVALNEFKLKYGFKELFNTSPTSMMLDYRMIEAKKLLETSEYSIGEISASVGYKYAQSFTNAFSSRFGILPKDLMKKRKYYY
ncbi:AraC family transcriptional regulator [Sulfurimonas sp.]|uniref:helix-turn-helix domain-containing protein n=1 Tax=Sulfurimonas sp. TaxID=2022749 RepID=UPI002B49AFA7|nr:AraC family transcriptional regulator [Sulfurimonas sp.]